MAVGVYRFGSIGSAVAYLRGDELIPDAYSKSFGVVTRGVDGSVEFHLKNWGDESIKVLRARSACGCVVASDLPVDIMPGAKSALTIRIRTKRKSGRISENIRLLTNTGKSGPILLVGGLVR